MELEHGSFCCTECDQIWHPSSSGGWGCTVLKTLWPESMTKDSRMYREQYMPAKLADLQFKAALEYAAGFETEEGYKARLAMYQAEYDAYFRVYRLPWYVRLWRWFAPR